MRPGADRLPGLGLAAITVGAGVLLLLAEAGFVTMDWDWGVALVCLTAGAGLLTVAPPSPGLYVGTLARLAGSKGKTLWGLRAATVVTAPIGGFGPAVYGVVTLLQALAEEPAAERQPDGRRSLGTGLACLGFVLAANAAGLSVGSDLLLWGVLVGSSGLSLYWWGAGSQGQDWRIRLAVAVLLVVLWLLAEVVQPEDGNVVAAVVGGAVLALLVAGPRWVRTSRALAAERIERARATERAELAGEVHDSVLQTLALIQSRSDDPAEVKALARRQERDLRSRLFGGADSKPLSLATALRAVAAEVEDEHRVKVDVVIVGDAKIDEASAALVASAREALFNAAKHAPDAPVSLFAEIDERSVSAYVRDRGPGFDLEAIPEDRRGVRDSIVARMVRHGGHAAVRTAPGGGCEVRLVQERRS